MCPPHTEEISPYNEVPTLVRSVGVVVTLGSLLFSIRVLHRFQRIFDFDDAYMFLRYAEHFRSGHGIVWNLHGSSTYGLTSLPWCGVIALASTLSLSMVNVVTLASWCSELLAPGVMALSIARESRTPLLRSAVCVFPLLSCWFLPNPYFDFNMVNGMETMLSLLLNALFCWGACRLLRAPTMAQAASLACLGALATLTRPEAALCVTAIPALGWLLLLLRKQSRVFAAYLGLYALLIAADLLVCRLYFHSALPLSFYMKSRHAYLGYANFWDWPQYLLVFLETVAPALLIVIVLGRARQLLLVLTFSLPVALTFVYLATVTQIMGMWARYYMPYAAFLILPAFIVLDECCMDKEPYSARPPFFRLAALLVLFFYPAEYQRVSVPAKMALRAYQRPVFHVPAAYPLPFVERPRRVFEAFTNVIAKPLPSGTEVAASEVGLLGATADQVDVLDLVGLNDTRIAHHGFTSAYVLQRAPDIIWFPHTDYTYLYGLLAADPALVKQYTVIAGAFNFGVAVRRDSPVYSATMARLHQAWSRLYPGTRLEDYIVDHVTWTPGPLIAAVANLPPVIGPLHEDAVPTHP